MARKPVLSGGKRDEIIEAATQLFFENGYEATSVRMIMDKVGGEIGMFYHYFKSKDMLFDKVAEKFFSDCRTGFEAMIKNCGSPQEFAEMFLPVYLKSMEQFSQIRGKMHWSVQAAMHSMTLEALKPAVASLIETWKTGSGLPADILAGQLLYGLSATIHSKGFEAMETEEKKKCITGFIGSVLGI